jgi:serine/threonine protein kinase/outer membrane protein assembly factor BamB
MPNNTAHPSIPEVVETFSLPTFDYQDLSKGDKIGAGGEANVFECTLTVDGESYTLALKEPRVEGTIQTDIFERYEEEAETWANLDDHQNIVSVHGYGTKSVPWIALEYMDGGTLADKIGEITLEQGLWMAGRIAEGIRYGHRHGIAHLDIKPNNVLLRSTPSGKWAYPKVSDWGLAKLLLEHSKSVEGLSPTYAAPEQFDAEEYGRPDDITDIYQFGTVVYALVTGQPPFSGQATDVMQSVLHKNPDPPSTVNSDIPEAVDEIILKTLSKEKDNRYQGMLPLLQDIDQVFEAYIGDSSVDGVESLDGEENTLNLTSGGSVGSTATTTEYDTAETDAGKKEETGQASSGMLSRRAALGLIGAGIVGVGSVGATQFMDLNSAEQESGSNENEVQSSGSDESSDVRANPVLSERWTGELGGDYIWNVGSAFYFSGPSGSGRAQAATMRWTGDKNIDGGRYHLPSDSFGYDQETVIFGFLADPGKEEPYSQAGAHFYAYDRESGEEKWTLTAPDDGRHRRAIASKVTEGVAALGVADWGRSEPVVYGVDSDIGETLWENSYSEHQLKNIIEYAGRFFLVFSSNLIVLDPNTGTELETLSKSTTGKSTLSANSLFGIDGNVVTSYRLDNKTTQWRSPTIENLSTVENHSGTIKVDNTNVFVGTENGSIHALNRTSGERVWQESITGEVNRIALSSYNVWVRNAGTGVFALNRDNGEIVHRSTHDAGGGIALDSDLLMLDGDGNIRAYWIEES